jgi:hypothetical protein
VPSEHHLGQRAYLAQTGRTSDSKRSGLKSATILRSGGRPHPQPVCRHKRTAGDPRPDVGHVRPGAEAPGQSGLVWILATGAGGLGCARCALSVRRDLHTI